MRFENGQAGPGIQAYLWPAPFKSIVETQPNSRKALVLRLHFYTEAVSSVLETHFSYRSRAKERVEDRIAGFRARENAWLY